MVDTLHETLQQSITVISELAADRVPEDSDMPSGTPWPNISATG
jgi:hypothetical protein